MDSLIANADAIRPLKKKKIHHNYPSSETGKVAPPPDATVSSIAKRTGLPRSLQPDEPLPKDAMRHIPDLKLRSHLTRMATHSSWSKKQVHEAELLLTNDGGKLETEGEMEKTWRVGQHNIVAAVSVGAGQGRKEWKLDGGSYVSRYSRNGRHLAVAGKKGHVATFDWQTGSLHSELQLRETVRDITFLQDQNMYAVAQRKYVFIYDKNGVELHRLSAHIEATRLEFLPYHWLLVSVGNPGYLRYQDTSTGQLIIEHRTKLGPCHTMAQNIHNAIIHLGHQNGTVTLWTPNLPYPAVRLLAHLGPVSSLSMDPSTGGRYMATSGQDGKIKVWDCRNWKGCIREWTGRSGAAVVEWSQKGILATASGGTVNLYNKPSIQQPHSNPAPPPLYMTHPIPSRPLTSVRFCPYQDILTIGHAAGLSSILVPGAGEANFDSYEADPFENKKARQEREVKLLLDKIQPDMISLDPDFIGNTAPPSKLSFSEANTTAFRKLPRLERLRIAGKADETELGLDDAEIEDDENAVGEGGKRLTQFEREEKAKMKMRGKGKSMKRYLKKKRKNIIDPSIVAIRAKLQKQREEKMAKQKAAAAKISGINLNDAKPSALDRFRRK